MVNKQLTIVTNSSTVPLLVQVTVSDEKIFECTVKAGESKSFYITTGGLKIKLSFLGRSGNWFGYNTTQLEDYEVEFDQYIGRHHSYIIKDEETNGVKELKVIDASFGF